MALGVRFDSADYTYHSRVFFDHANSAPDYLQHASAWRAR